jgi:hypothetical protein
MAMPTDTPRPEGAGAARRQAEPHAAWPSSPAAPAPRRRWRHIALLLLPVLGVGFVWLAPWLLPGEPIVSFAVTPPQPLEVGRQLVGPVTYTLDARAHDRWTYFDFSRGSVVDVPHQFSLDWDLAFQRHKILANGGATNPKGRGAILDLGEVPFEAVTEAPADGYVEDTIASITADGIVTENRAIKAWYRYSWLTHLLRPKPHVYVVRTADGKYAKLRILSYYCGEGQASGCFTLAYVYQGDGSRRLTP